MDDLKINQIEIASTVNVMTRKMQTIVSAVDGSFKATATMIIEQDLKMYIRHLLLVQQNAIQRYTHIMLSASVKQTSPFALTQKELDATADELKTNKGIILARDLSSTRMTASIINNELYIQIEIPIIQENNLFNFYQIKPIPIFTGNLTLIPEMDATAIAISKTGSDYAIITEEEFDNYIHRPWQCQISTLIISLSQNSHCVASTYVTQELKCPLHETEDKIQPFFHIDGNHTIYSCHTKLDCMLNAQKVICPASTKMKRSHFKAWAKQCLNIHAPLLYQLEQNLPLQQQKQPKTHLT